MPRLARLAALLGAAAALSAAVPAHAAPPVQFGFNENGPGWGSVTPADAARLMAGAGATVHRITFDWRWAQPAPGQWRLATYDAIYRADLAAGIRPMLILTFAPQWTWAAGTPCVQAAQDCRYPPGADHMDAWHAIVQTLLRRYPQLAGLEIWNEPNLRTFWQSGPDPAAYATLVREAYAAARAIGSPVPIIGGALSNFPGGNPANGVGYRAFLSGMYAAGVKGSMDALSLHPYPGGADLGRTFKMLTEVRDIRDANGDATPLWISELGDTSTPGAPLGVSEADQATVLARLVADLRAMPDVRGIAVHTLVEPTRFGMASGERGYGVLRPDLSPKPAYCALAAVNGVAGACPAPAADPAQLARWSAQEQLQQAADAARAYRAAHGTYLGLTGAAVSTSRPILATAWTNVHGQQLLLLCDTSDVGRSYCIETTPGGPWVYGHADGNVYRAAAATTHGASTSW